MRRLLLVVAAFAVVAAACGDSGGAPGALPAGTFPIVASTDLAVGTDRLLVALAAPDNRRLGGPDLEVDLRLYHSETPDDDATYPATWMWATEDVSGLYRAEVEFDRPGTWFVDVVTEGGPPVAATAFTVRETPLTPALGSPAPRSDTATAGDVADLAEISTDPEPDSRFYEMSVAEAVASGRPTVVVFATPRFCQTAICGPTLDEVKEIAAAHPEANFVHVEVYTNLDDPDALEVVPAVGEWGLTSEPWVFVVDAAGNVSGRFEGVVDPDEIDSALAS